jgi:predicted ATPase
LQNNQRVIAIANSIHDKFDSGHRNFKTLRGRSGRRQTRNVLKRALENIADSNIQRLKNASQVLSYVGFDPMIGFKIDKLVSNYREIIAASDLAEIVKESILSLLESTQKETLSEQIVWLQVDRFNFEEIHKSSLSEIFIWEPILKGLKIITRIEVFLRKQQKVISMLDASSGELALITSLVYVSTVITEGTVILIDEPENSLHPKWQKEYVKVLFDLFYLFQPKIIIATHSPLVVNGAELFTQNPKIYKADGFTFEIQKKEPTNIEETLFRFFNINTPQNRFLSDRIVRFLNLLANDKMTFPLFEKEIKRIEQNSYDPKQIEVLKSVIALASEISTLN